MKTVFFSYSLLEFINNIIKRFRFCFHCKAGSRKTFSLVQENRFPSENEVFSKRKELPFRVCLLCEGEGGGGGAWCVGKQKGIHKSCLPCQNGGKSTKCNHFP